MKRQAFFLFSERVVFVVVVLLFSIAGYYHASDVAWGLLLGALSAVAVGLLMTGGKEDDEDGGTFSFSFSEKSSFAVMVFVACFAAYFLPVNIIWYRISSALSIFVLLAVAATILDVEV